eukprot:8407189-Heterocapsa_arctica.AAC.1
MASRVASARCRLLPWRILSVKEGQNDIYYIIGKKKLENISCKVQMKEGQSDIYYTIGENIALVSA